MQFIYWLINVTSVFSVEAADEVRRSQMCMDVLNMTKAVNVLSVQREADSAGVKQNSEIKLSGICPNTRETLQNCFLIKEQEQEE